MLASNNKHNILKTLSKTLATDNIIVLIELYLVITQAIVKIKHYFVTIVRFYTRIKFFIKKLNNMLRLKKEVLCLCLIKMVLNYYFGDEFKKITKNLRA